MLTRLIVVVAILCLTSCDRNSSSRISRLESPESSFEAARASLQRRDLDGYFDALTDRAVRSALSNSISICTLSFHSEIQQYGYEPSYGCEAVLDKYGWVKSKSDASGMTTEFWNDAIAAIKQPRQMAAELEKLHRDNDSGSSFVWEYLDPVEIYDVKIIGNTASATADWSQDVSTVHFEKDDTGWRFNPDFE